MIRIKEATLNSTGTQELWHRSTCVIPDNQACLNTVENIQSRQKGKLECNKALNRLASNSNRITSMSGLG